MNSKSLPKAIRILFKTLKRQTQFKAYLLIALSILSGLAEAFTIGASLPLIIRLAKPEDGSLPSNNWFISLISASPTHSLSLVFGLFAGAILFSTAIRLYLLRKTHQFTQLAGEEIASKCFANLLHRPYNYHIAHTTSHSIALCTNGISIVVNQVLLPTITIISSLIIASIVAILIMAFNPTTTLLILGFFITLYATTARLSKTYLQSLGGSIGFNQIKAIEAIQTGLGNIREITLSKLHDYYTSRFSHYEGLHRQKQGSFNTLTNSKRYIVECIAISLMVLLSYLSSNVPASASWTLVTLGVYALTAQRVLPLLHQSYVAWASMQNGAETLSEILLILHGNATPSKDTNPIKFQQVINLRGCSFHYPDTSTYVIKNLSLQIQKGERIAIVGPSGSGKTTLLDLLSGLLTPTAGELFIDGLKVGPRNLHLWQDQIGYVPQQIFIANQTIAENIAIGFASDDINMERIRHAAANALIADFISNLPHGYDTLCGENGIRLSGGQRQRIGIARALYARKAVLILDEPTSALDEMAEAEIIKSIERLGRDITVIAVTHRISFAEACDRIIRIEHC